ncbi:hypothetical protein BZA03_106103 [Alteromonas sp. I10]|uniref:hypothetical protein n=1 Tax=Alteromonas TaxID=226 RepID=UPI00057C9297|nr:MULTISPECIES: hypothetical protein [Alteromonas]MCG7646460.1 hypothetical protein [Alteromonas sp. Cnat3-28]KHT55473.1 hypothetical protein RJ43_06735 [Alteromonas macleodii]OLF73330.1 hypothetical protein AWH61_15535 [Alteromonas sp. W12]OZB99501.1 hypothetical protein BBP29_01920 [Alteromonas macleodii]PXW73110.1 hypothetical protein BZA03_106103 [Alteromonas sp. I10]
MASTKTGLLNFVVIGVLLAVIGTTYVFYATPIIDEAEKVNKENAVAQFQRVVMLARAQWIKTKQDTVLIYETEFDAGGKVKQHKDVAAELYINEKGWPEGLEKEQGNACEYMLTLATLREGEALSTVTVSDQYANGYLQCAFFWEKEIWFEYNAGSGVVRQRNS